MIVWEARRAKRGDQERILCGRMVNGEYDCRELVARKALWSSDEQGPPERDEIMLPVGLTDEGSPGEYRWTGDALRRRDRYQSVPRRRAGARDRVIRLGGSAVIVPCLANHRNRVDGSHL